jgi:diguanylate cyclase (GGDEF)-like protein/PAS domain S-box-containing protein
LQIRDRRTASGHIVGFQSDITDVKRETIRLRTVIDNFPGGISLFDVDLNLVACNEAFRTLLDLPAELFEQGLPTLEAIFRSNAERGEYGPGEIDQQVSERLELARRNESHELQRVRPNGVVLEVRGIPVPGGGFISTYVDVTRRCAAERKLAESEQIATGQSETLKVTLAHMSQGLSMFDGQDELIVWNDRFGEIYRFPEELLRQGSRSRSLSAHLIEMGFTETDEPRWRQRIAEGETFSARIRNRDGRVIKVVYTAVQGSGWVATHEDITERIRTQAQLARQAELLAQSYVQLDAALSNMSQGLILFDHHGKVVLTNRRFSEIYGYGADDASPGRSVREIVEAYAKRHATDDFKVDEYVDEIAKESSRILNLTDGRIIQVHRAPAPDGGWVATHEDITDRERSAQRIIHLAFHDPLTGLANRAEFNRRGEEALSRAGDNISVILVDLDRFKSVNDTLGHAAGDQLLKLAASRMRAIARSGDVVARVGGDEFAILQAPAANQREAAISLATRLTEIVAQPYDLGGKPAIIGASIGVAVRSASDDTIETLLHRADLALYEVKSLGRNSCMVYDDNLGSRAEERLVLETDLRAAIFGGELELHYQPIVSLLDRQICGFEALVRWRHPTRGLLSPDRFIPIAEEAGLIVPLGEFVIRQACVDASNWPDHIKVAVNISPTHLMRRNLLDTVVDALLETRIDARRLEIEVTETVLLKHDEDVLSELHQLRNLGLSVALDDFGTGYSSLSHLRMFSFDKVKVDRSFVSEITERPDSAAIVCAITGLGRALEMQITAEGIETEHQLLILKAAGCSQGQGYLFGRPMPASEAMLLILSEQVTAGGTRSSAILN